MNISNSSHLVGTHLQHGLARLVFGVRLGSLNSHHHRSVDLGYMVGWTIMKNCINLNNSKK